jgi:hypothetical protein
MKAFLNMIIKEYQWGRSIYFPVVEALLSVGELHVSLHD